jgi:hypothetical protein
MLAEEIANAGEIHVINWYKIGNYKNIRREVLPDNSVNIIAQGGAIKSRTLVKVFLSPGPRPDYTEQETEETIARVNKNGDERNWAEAYIALVVINEKKELVGDIKWVQIY